MYRLRAGRLYFKSDPLNVIFPIYLELGPNGNHDAPHRA